MFTRLSQNCREGAAWQLFDSAVDFIYAGVVGRHSLCTQTINDRNRAHAWMRTYFGISSTKISSEIWLEHNLIDTSGLRSKVIDTVPLPA